MLLFLSGCISADHTRGGLEDGQELSCELGGEESGLRDRKRERCQSERDKKEV